MKNNSTQKKQSILKTLKGKMVKPLCLCKGGKKFMVAMFQDGTIPMKNNKYIRFKSIR